MSLEWLTPIELQWCEVLFLQLILKLGSINHTYLKGLRAQEIILKKGPLHIKQKGTNFYNN